jgi:hypothetical protein
MPARQSYESDVATGVVAGTAIGSGCTFIAPTPAVMAFDCQSAKTTEPVPHSVNVFRILVGLLVVKIQALYDQRGAGLLGPEGEAPADLAKTGVERPGRCLVVAGKDAGFPQVAVRLAANWPLLRSTPMVP